MEVTQYSHFDVNLILSYIKIVLDCQYGLESNKLCKIIIRLTCLDIHWIRMGYPSSSGIRVLGSAWVQVNLRKTSRWPSAENEFHHFTVVEVLCEMTRITMGLLQNMRNEKYYEKLFFISEALNIAFNINWNTGGMVRWLKKSSKEFNDTWQNLHLKSRWLKIRTIHFSFIFSAKYRSRRENRREIQFEAKWFEFWAISVFSS